jgi:hypothetical protein
MNVGETFPDPRDRFTLTAEREYRASLRPIYRVAERARGPRPEHIASCLLLNVDGTPFICTAAHVADDLTEHLLFVGGLVGTRPIHILGGAVKTTDAPGGARDLDRVDLAFWRPSAAAIARLGAVEFLDATRIANDKASTSGRLYTAIGYPRSRNKKKVNHTKKQIDIRISMYTSDIVKNRDLCEEMGVSGTDHLFLSWAERSFMSDGERQNTFHPRGLSGGALLDLGEFTSAQSFERDATANAKLAGMVIEYYAEHRALVAVKIGVVIDRIRNLVARGSGWFWCIEGYRVKSATLSGEPNDKGDCP